MVRKIRLFGIGLLSALLWAGTSAAESYHIDALHSSIGFSIRHLMSRVSGSFADFSGTVIYDPAHPEKTAADITIQATSINTLNERRDNHLRGADFFEVETYPAITFKSTSAKQDGDKILVTGDFAMRGVTRQITLSVEILGLGTHPRNKAPMAGFATETTLKCSDYGVNNWANFVNVLGDEVRVTITLAALADTE